VFSPKEAVQEHWEEAALQRKTKVPPSQVKRAEQRAKNPKRQDGEFYSTQSYGKAIKRSIKAANRTLSADRQIPLWSPYQLRHAKATEVAAAAGLDVCRAVLGQRTINVTQRYNHSDRQKAIDYVRDRQNLTAVQAGSAAQSD
jgi:integrase